MFNPMMLQQIMANQQQFAQFQQQFGQFAQQFQNGPQMMNPQAIIQQKLNSGEMSQQQFEQLRMMANQIMGINR